jgi:hypothetical protein
MRAGHAGLRASCNCSSWIFTITRASCKHAFRMGVHSHEDLNDSASTMWSLGRVRARAHSQSHSDVTPQPHAHTHEYTRCHAHTREHTHTHTCTHSLQRRIRYPPRTTTGVAHHHPHGGTHRPLRMSACSTRGTFLSRSPICSTDRISAALKSLMALKWRIADMLDSQPRACKLSGWMGGCTPVNADCPGQSQKCKNTPSSNVQKRGWVRLRVHAIGRLDQPAGECGFGQRLGGDDKSGSCCRNRRCGLKLSADLWLHRMGLVLGDAVGVAAEAETVLVAPADPL